jgi:hypothetical protein
MAKKIKRENLTIGMQVVVNNEPDATVYTIAELEGFNAKLTYECAGKTLSGGWTDTSLLLKPTAAQLPSTIPSAPNPQLFGAGGFLLPVQVRLD